MLVLLTLAATYLLALFKTQKAQITAAIVLPVIPIGLAFLFYGCGYDFKLVPTELSVVICTSSSIIHRYMVIGKQERFIRHSFRHYLSPLVIDQLIEHPEKLKLGGERKELTVFFSDLEGFTSISEGLGPEDLTHLLNDYLTDMTDIILEEHGTVDKFEGDAIIAFWNAPLDVANHAEFAVRAALRCQERLAQIRPEFIEEYGKVLNMRIGINTGPAVVGNMGSSTRFDYTVLGDAVNLAARLEGANKQFGTYTMISESTHCRLDTRFTCRELARIRVVGRKEPVTVYEPLSYSGVQGADAVLQSFADGLRLFYNGDFALAHENFIKTAGQDNAARLYALQCEKFIQTAPDEWDGVWELGSK